MNGGKPSYTSTWSVKQLMRSSLKARVICPLLSNGGGEGPYTTSWLLLLNEDISHRQLAVALFVTPGPSCVEMKPWVTLVRILRVWHSWKHNPPFLQVTRLQVSLDKTDYAIAIARSIQQDLGLRFSHKDLGSITSHCSGKEPALLSRHERAADRT